MYTVVSSVLATSGQWPVSQPVNQIQTFLRFDRFVLWHLVTLTQSTGNCEHKYMYCLSGFLIAGVAKWLSKADGPHSPIEETKESLHGNFE